MPITLPPRTPHPTLMQVTGLSMLTQLTALSIQHSWLPDIAGLTGICSLAVKCVSEDLSDPFVGLSALVSLTKIEWYRRVGA